MGDYTLLFKQQKWNKKLAQSHVLTITFAARKMNASFKTATTQH